MNHLVERRQEEKERRRLEILDAAEAVAGEVGIDAMTMDQVARKARLSRALLYVYFQDKDDLLFGLCNRALDILHRRFLEAVGRHREGIAQVEACGRAYVAFAQEFPVYAEALAAFEAHSVERVAGEGNVGACVIAGDRVHAVLIAAIEHGMRDGSVRPDAGPPLLVSFTLWGFLHGVIQLATNKATLLAHDGVTTQQLLDQALLQGVRSIATRR
ncbi:MAG: TetR/AcrR family transcriptional regulator [Steroidobacteraceae bacterium]|jgi:AcrR family transcriptional regulator|nr:TetR/AcrR family transcriptional regulator [Steroidobacteraceae bacterium]